VSSAVSVGVMKKLRLKTTFDDFKSSPCDRSEEGVVRRLVNVVYSLCPGSFPNRGDFCSSYLFSKSIYLGTKVMTFELVLGTLNLDLGALWIGKSPFRYWVLKLL
jgi:hypothetical protein